MVWTVERATGAEADLDLIFDFLPAAAQRFGKPPDRAFDQAARRLLAMEDAISALGRAPYQATLVPDLLPGLRHVTKERAVIHFDTDAPMRRIRVLAVFFGGQDPGGIC